MELRVTLTLCRSDYKTQWTYSTPMTQRLGQHCAHYLCRTVCCTSLATSGPLEFTGPFDDFQIAEDVYATFYLLARNATPEMWLASKNGSPDELGHFMPCSTVSCIARGTAYLRFEIQMPRGTQILADSQS